MRNVALRRLVLLSVQILISSTSRGANMFSYSNTRCPIRHVQFFFTRSSSLYTRIFKKKKAILARGVVWEGVKKKKQVRCPVGHHRTKAHLGYDDRHIENDNRKWPFERRCLRTGRRLGLKASSGRGGVVVSCGRWKQVRSRVSHRSVAKTWWGVWYVCV